MARQFSLPQNLKVVQLIAPTTTNGGFDSRRVNLANAHKAWIVVDLMNAAGAATTATLKQADAISSGNTANGPASALNWKNEDTASGDTLTKGGNANAVATDANAKSKQIVFEVLPEDLASGYQYVYANLSDSAQVTNFASVTAYLLERYQQATPPSAAA